MFDAAVKSNKWDDKMAALQSFAHVEGYALNMGEYVEYGRATLMHMSVNKCYQQLLTITKGHRQLPTAVRWLPGPNKSNW